MATARRQLGYVSTLITETVPLMSWGTATGGIGSPVSSTISGVNYQYLTFTSTGTLTVTKAGLFDIMIIGGGAGGVIQYTIYLSANETITVGAGGGAGGFGGRSSIGATRVGILAMGGGPQNGTFDTGFYGASTGGGRGGAGAPTTAETFYGFNGGAGASNGAGGGGGAGGAGVTATTNNGGAGGIGVDVSLFIGGSALFKAAGGGGGGSSAGGAGGSSIGGAGGTASGTSAAANTASGGGGCPTGTAGSGGSGIVYVRWRV